MIAVAAVGLGLLIGLTLGTLGGGGSILTVPALVYVLGQDARSATTSSLFIVGIASLIAAFGHARSRPGALGHRPRLRGRRGSPQASPGRR